MSNARPNRFCLLLFGMPLFDALTAFSTSSSSEEVPWDNTPLSNPISVNAAKKRPASGGKKKPSPTKYRKTPPRGSTTQALIDATVARLPPSARQIRWVLNDGPSGSMGHFARAAWGEGAVYVAPKVPPNLLYDTMIHEWGHFQQIWAYGSDINRSREGMQQIFGPDKAHELCADCIAKELGAKWLHYTQCTNPAWRTYARQLINGQPPN